jgi:hypothetical protein
MDSKTTKKIILGFIVILAVIIWSYNVTLFFPKSSHIKKIFTTTETAKKEERLELKPQVTLSSLFTYEVKYKDPFRAPFLRLEEKPKKKVKPQIEEPPPKYILSGILWDKKNPLAVISDSTGNTFTVKEGDIIEKIKIIKVSKDEVWYRFKNKIIKLSRVSENK